MDLRNVPVLKIIYSKTFWIKSAILVAGMIILVFLMDLVIMPFYTKHGDEFELPDVTDKPVNEARQLLENHGFNPLIKDSVYDEHFPPDYVVQQNPLPFSRVKKGRRIYLVVSIGEKPHDVPKLIGLTQQDAEFKIREAGLKLDQKLFEYSDFYPRGVVIKQSLPPQEVVKKNREVDITISLGPPPTSLEVPNLVGKSLESAKTELETVGMRIGEVKYRYRANLVPGTVLNQSVEPGEKVVNADSLNLIVSTDEPLPTEDEDGKTPQ